MSKDIHTHTTDDCNYIKEMNDPTLKVGDVVRMQYCRPFDFNKKRPVIIDGECAVIEIDGVKLLRDIY